MGGAKLINAKGQEIRMYATSSAPRVEVCGDLWEKGRYRVELAARLPCEFADVDDGLEKLGYEVIDAGQWGRSYRNRQDPRHTAELDELDDAGAYVRLILRKGDLEAARLSDAEGEVDLTYARLRAACPARSGEYPYKIINPADVDYDCNGDSPGFRFSSPRTRH